MRLLRDVRNSIKNYGEAPRLYDYDSLSPQRSNRPTGRPVVSVVTCVFNAEKTLQNAMDSVKRQSWPNIEYVVVDGASTDGTRAIIDKNKDMVDVLLSEPDEGLYDAFNRGVAISTGEYVAVLNADDAIAPDHLEQSVRALEDSGADFSYGDVQMIHDRLDGQHIEIRPADHNYEKTLKSGTTDLHHATMVVRRSVFEDIGLFRTGLKIAADYDWFIRMVNAGYRGVYSGVTSQMNYGGVSTERQELSIIEAAYVAFRNGGSKRAIAKFWGPILLRRLRWRLLRAIRGLARG